jgi:predicted nucleic acid-binding Zn ribbon protein
LLFLKRTKNGEIFFFRHGMLPCLDTFMPNRGGVMETDGGKMCPVCGSRIVGRTDKKYCSDECRAFVNNRKWKERRNMIGSDANLAGIERDLEELCRGGGRRYLKFIAAITSFCKIMYKFGHQKEQI